MGQQQFHVTCWRCVEKSCTYKTLGDAVQSLRQVPNEIKQQDLKMISGCDRYDNSNINFGPDSQGRTWRMKHCRKLKAGLFSGIHHDCKVTVDMKQRVAGPPPGMQVGYGMQGAMNADLMRIQQGYGGCSKHDKKMMKKQMKKQKHNKHCHGGYY